jgi:hypothetical protein
MAQYFRIATKDFCNTLKPGSFTGDTMMCPTRSQIESAGLHIKKGYTYAADQLVPEDHIVGKASFVWLSLDLRQLPYPRREVHGNSR